MSISTNVLHSVEDWQVLCVDETSTYIEAILCLITE